MTTALEAQEGSHGFPPPEEDEFSLLALGSALLRGRRTIVRLGLAGGLVGVAIGLLSPKVFRSSATFIPQPGEPTSGSGLAALAASQFGIRVSTGGGGVWSSSMYVEVLKSRALLDPVARDSFAIADDARSRVPLVDLLRTDAPTPELRIEAAVEALRKRVVVREDKKLGMVTISTTTAWPSVSLGLIERLLSRLNDFNLATRRSQAVAERQFVEREALAAEQLLRQAEDRLQDFRQRNKVISSSPALLKENDRLAAEITLRNQLYTSWMQSREEARIREVRDTPVLTILDAPVLAQRREARGTIKKGVIGILAGALLGVLLAIATQEAKQRNPSPEEREFLALVREAIPRTLRRGA
jgi:uncharacterized protein involved in exopolysaccharide biosynthesis